MVDTKSKSSAGGWHGTLCYFVCTLQMKEYLMPYKDSLPVRCGQPRSRGFVATQCAKNPVPIGVGYLAQYIVKPLLGFTIAKVPSIMALHPC